MSINETRRRVLRKLNSRYIYGRYVRILSISLRQLL